MAKKAYFKILNSYVFQNKDSDREDTKEIQRRKLTKSKEVEYKKQRFSE